MTNIVNSDDTIVGLSGRTLKISDYMKANNSSNEYRLGLKSLSDLYPSRIREKIAADSKQKQWDENNKRVLADISRDMADFDGKNSSMNAKFLCVICLFLSLYLTFIYSHYSFSKCIIFMKRRSL